MQRRVDPYLPCALVGISDWLVAIAGLGRKVGQSDVDVEPPVMGDGPFDPNSFEKNLWLRQCRRRVI